MSSVLSLIAARPERLAAADVAGMRGVVDSMATEVGEAVWLAADEACEISFRGDRPTVLESARAAFAGRRIDVNVVPAANRRKRLLLADMDSTLIEQECIDELAAEIGVGIEVAAITERAMRGEIAFEPALRARVGLLAGLRIEIARKVLAERIRLMPGAEMMVATMRASGAHTALVSGGFTLFAAPIAERLGFHEHRANVLLAEAGAFTGRVAEPILGLAAKADTLRALARDHALSLEDTLAVGDGANDANMVRTAGLGVAYRAKPALRAVAAASIEHADLTGLLFLQGFRRDEFAG